MFRSKGWLTYTNAYLFQGNRINRIDKQKNPLENTYNTDPDEGSPKTNVDVFSDPRPGDARKQPDTTVVKQPANGKKKRKRRKRKGKKRSKVGKTRQPLQPIEAGTEDVDTVLSRPVLQNVDIRVKYCFTERISYV